MDRLRLSRRAVLAAGVGGAASATLPSGAIAQAGARTAAGVSQLLAPRPPMGWNSWNKFACDINEQLVRETADAMVASEMTIAMRGRRMKTDEIIAYIPDVAGCGLTTTPGRTRWAP